MKIAIASMGNPSALGTWSGIPAHIFFTLKQKGHKVIPITLHPSKEPWYYNWLRRYYFRIHKKWFLAAVEERFLKEVGSSFDAAVAKVNPDLVIVIHGDWLAHTTFHHPACIIHDTTFAKLVDYYPAFSKLTSRSIKMGNLMYQRALKRANAAVFSAKWASNSAILDYGTPASKVHTIPFGANIKMAPELGEIETWIEHRGKNSCCNFLFLGVDWNRKGGPDALRFVIELNRRGIESYLIIVGCHPEIPYQFKPFVQRKGFLRKDNEFESSLLLELFRTSHALILPSMAECYGCVYCEANAYGLPALGRDTGGVSEIIKDGVNGLLININESPEALADRWEKIWEDGSSYSKLSLNSRREYDNRLNYQIFTVILEKILINLLQNNTKE